MQASMWDPAFYGRRITNTVMFFCFKNHRTPVQSVSTTKKLYVGFETVCFEIQVCFLKTALIDTSVKNRFSFYSFKYMMIGTTFYMLLPEFVPL